MSDSSQAIEAVVSETRVFDRLAKHLPLTEKSLADIVTQHAKTQDYEFVKAQNFVDTARQNAGVKDAEIGVHDTVAATQVELDAHGVRLRDAVSSHVKEVFDSQEFVPLRNDLEGAQSNYARVSNEFKKMDIPNADKAREAFASVLERKPEEHTVEKLRKALVERDIGGTNAATAAEDMLAVHTRLQATHGAVVEYLNAHVDVKPLLTSEPVVASVIPEVSLPENAVIDAVGGEAKQDAGLLEKLYKTEGKVSKLKVGGLAVAVAAAGYAMFGGKDEKPEKAQVQMAGASVQPMQPQMGMAR